jgi:hypothetical protein
VVRPGRPSLPLMDRPYEGIELLLQLVAQHSPTQSELDALVAQYRQGSLQRLYYNPGKEDILYFCHKQLGLFDVRNNRLQLTDNGRKLYRFLHTPQFGMHLFQHLVECSREKFTYFYRVYEALEMRARSGEFEMLLSTFNSLLHEKSNKRSSKEIRRLLFGCGAVRQEDDNIVIIPSFFSVNLRQKQLEHLWASVPQILENEGRLTYAEVVTRLRHLHPSSDWDELEAEFRSGLILSRTRASEYVDGVRSSTPGV